jgi:hypothetical protein
MRMLPDTIARTIAARPPSPHDLDARWRDAIATTVALWAFVLLVYLPVIVQLHLGEGIGSVLLDASTILVSMLLAMPLFALFRASEGWSPSVRLIALTLAVMAVAIVQAAFDLLYTGWIAAHVERAWFALPTDLKRGYGAALRYANVYAVNAVLFQLVASRRRVVRQERQLADIVATRQRAELDWLRLKLNPHFLFNTLNSISGLVVTRRNEQAELAIEHLSAFLRASLAGDPAVPIPVEEEIALVEHYVRIEEMRFGERLAVALDCTDAAAALTLPALTIQPLVELAVRDGVGPSSRPVNVAVSATTEDTGLLVTIADDARRQDGGALATLVDDMRRRLAALYGPAARLDTASGVTGTTTTIRVPGRAMA